MATTTKSNGKPAPTEATIVSMTRKIPIDQINVDESINSRTVYDPEEEKNLKHSLGNQGQLQPVKVEEVGPDKYNLVYGFRRMRAAKALGWSGIDAQVVPPMEPWRRLVANGAENLARENLTTFDQANLFLKMHKIHELSGVKVGQLLGKSTQHVNNLLRIAQGVDESILERWELECQPNFGFDPETKKAIPTVRRVCTMDWLGKLAANIPKAEQKALLDKELGLVADDEPSEDKGDSNRNPAPPGSVNKRPSKKNLEDALEAATAKLKEAKTPKEKDELSAIIKTLKFALGTNKSIAGVYTMPKDNAQAE